jgi:hypothetical protein
LERVEDVCCWTRYLYLICYLNVIGAGVYQHGLYIAMARVL